MLTLLLSWLLIRSPAPVESNVKVPAPPVAAVVSPSTQEALPSRPELVAPGTPSLARVELTVFPPNAEVRFDQQRVGAPSGVAIFYAIPDRSHSLLVTSPGFTARTEQLRLSASERRTLNVTLEPEPAPPPVQRPKPGRGKPKPSKEIIDPF